MPNRAIEIHDSALDQITLEAGVAVLEHGGLNDGNTNLRILYPRTQTTQHRES